MFSEIMPAFTEMAEKFIMKTKNSEKRALFSIKCSRSALSIVDKILENWKNTKKKTTSVDEKERDDVKLHAALYSTEYYFLGNLRTQKGYIAQWTWQGFHRQSELNFFSRPGTRREKSLCIEAILRRNYN